MSEYGPAFFIKRIDEQEIDKKEQDMLLKHVIEISKRLKIKDDEDNIILPKFYDYDGYEKKSIAFLMFSSIAWGMMPEEVQLDESAAHAEQTLKIGNEIDKKIPNTYSYKCYFVEN